MQKGNLTSLKVVAMELKEFNNKVGLTFSLKKIGIVRYNDAYCTTHITISLRKQEIKGGENDDL